MNTVSTIVFTDDQLLLLGIWVTFLENKKKYGAKKSKVLHFAVPDHLGTESRRVLFSTQRVRALPTAISEHLEKYVGKKFEPNTGISQTAFCFEIKYEHIILVATCDIREGCFVLKSLPCEGLNTIKNKSQYFEEVFSKLNISQFTKKIRKEGDSEMFGSRDMVKMLGQLKSPK